MDEIFGKKNFQNEIIWWYYNVANVRKEGFGKKHDVILWYSKSDKWIFNHEEMREPYEENSNWVKNPASYKDAYSPNPRGKRMQDVWRMPTINNMAKERTGYPTQKPLALLERIIKASSNKGDMVLDPFCGCATTCVAAEKLDRQWIGIDISEKAAELVKERISNELGLLLFDPIHRTDIPGDRGGKRSRDIKNVLYGKQEGMCGGCGHWYRIKDFEVDHIIPRSKGGANRDENLQLLCGNCNRIKGDKSQEYLISRVRSMAG